MYLIDELHADVTVILIEISMMVTMVIPQVHLKNGKHWSVDIMCHNARD